MRNSIVYRATVFLGILSSSLTEAGYSGSKDVYSKQSGFDSTYNGYLGEYAGQLSAGKALGELQGLSESSQLAPEHGSQFEEGESHNFSESYGEQSDSDDSSIFDKYNESFESLKIPQDVETHHYTGGVSSDIGLRNDHRHHYHKQHNFESHNYQIEENAKNSDFKGYRSFEGTQIVPYSGSEESEQHEESPSDYSGYEHAEENEVSKGPTKSYEGSATPVKSYESSVKAPATSYVHSFENSKIAEASYETSKPSKASASSYSHFYDGSKSAKSLGGHSYDSSKSVSFSSHEPSLGSYGIKHHQLSVQEAPIKVDAVHKFKSSGHKDYHASLQKNIMTINHGKGGYSFSSLYRS